MNDLALYGWTASLQALKEASVFSDMTHGRVTVTHKTCYEVVSATGFFTCELSGNMLYGRESDSFPCTGDWVLFQPVDDGRGIILDMLPRHKTLYRLRCGTESERQVIASNVDKVFIVQSLDDNFNVRRLERMMMQVTDSGIEPVVVLTKTDLGFDRQEAEKALRHIINKTVVFWTSTGSPGSIDLLRGSIRQGETVVFTGSSGVGKSTLINALCRKHLLDVAEISSSTGKGRHTSTRREMVLMDSAGVLIDTPGIKVFGVTGDDPSNLADMLDLSSYEGACRYSDCRHVNEKGCAVIRAVENGEIEKGVYESYLKLMREAWHYTASVQEKRKREKSFAKMVKEFKNNHTKNNDL